MVKKKFKKIVNWSYKWYWESIIPALMGLIPISIPILYHINISFDDGIKNSMARGYLIFGGILIFISLILFFGCIKREQYYKEV